MVSFYNNNFQVVENEKRLVSIEFSDRLYYSCFIE